MMMLFTNNASSRLYAAVDAVTTSIRVQAGDGGKFPIPTGDGSDYFAVTLEDRRSGQLEICNCFARSGDILNVQRGKEGTIAQAFELGATVSNRLTAATMDFLAHAGATGPQGPQGEVGATGPTGPQGPTGATGAASTIPGPPGPQGQSGVTGPQGLAGTPGAQGPMGTQGSQGQKGDAGPAGPIGPQGPEGAAGTGINMQGQVPSSSALPSTGNQVGDAYVTTDTQHLWVWSEEGYWADLGNVVGPQGPVGPSGPQGVAGPQGVTGPPGEQGIPGPIGPEGPQGTTDWDDLTNVPAAFPPELPIPWTDVSGKPATFPPTLPIPYADISGKPATFPPTLPIAQSGITNLTTDLAAKANLNSPTFIGDPTAPTPATADNDTSIATTAFVKAQGYAPLASPIFTGDPTAPTPATADNDTSIATSAFVRAAIAAYALTDAPADGLVYGRKDNNWATVIGGATTSDGPPTPPLQNGQLWWETDTGNLHIYYNDGNSSQWVQLTGQPSGSSSVNIDKIVSPAATANMLAGFKTGPNRFVVNSQADGLGFDVLTAYRSGALQLNGMPLSFYVSQSPNLRFAINASADGTGTEVFSVDNGGSVQAGIITSSGSISASGAVTAPSMTATGGSGFISNQVFQSSVANVIVSSTGAGTVYLRPNGAASATGQMTVGSNGSVGCSNNVSAPAFEGGHFNTGLNVAVNVSGNFRGKNGISVGGGGYSGNFFALLWNSVATVLFVDNTNLGTINTTSDYRIKKDVTELPSTWDRVKALRPISYTQAEFTPPMSPETEAALPDDPKARPSPDPLFAADDIERWGFIAHEIQETLLMAAASGHKDMVDGVQGLNWGPILAATVKALQEAMARIEALEAARV